MDLTAPIGLLIALVGIVGGRVLEGGNPLFLIQHTAFVIVFGGTVGAMIYGSRSLDILSFPKHLRKTFVKNEIHPEEVIPQLVRFAEKARREGLLSLEREVPNVQDEYLKQGLQLVADGTDPEIVKSIMTIQLEQQETRHERVIKMYESGAGYAPTIGIIGAVLGLISVMEHLHLGIEKVGPGIAVAFVATIYGLVLANILLFPMAGKLKLNSHAELHVREMILEGILSIQAGDNPRIIEERLKAFLSAEERLAYEESREARKNKA
ncbi:motility protein A [bacterium (Candidatus Blackallbacteria) CG17_big_fil_post_rev_8_21_14_2_50_48_46]|uniref:Motility protein A n=1 Tax=bacterium (Candidatus Blackallbacteria) CG17_big_fil_post_rev_8_21_14_2_50_48_46 TaxID=2014261 RepID=A0A2M7G3W2_9BACT|nr:MAG: motility protein A [bacterium (Candidatus Blackallbacteria) CG18_big_fil_WC_8_21_14_2_50_49_26]PIW16549.1 MAG: motility protein A [bacterium (Candidatus Blackallbacteria) CG17_big_fil_post_rev_8_21_14_2_50_48_46]PIW46057.1 MAG: motility protein A [bacterium (Candidatus Blackallbacteria) CG13_big_fil_rev_8_21_14_2_50_49_14]